MPARAGWMVAWVLAKMDSKVVSKFSLKDAEAKMKGLLVFKSH